MNKKELKYLVLIFVIFIAACIETDIYLPAFPDMMNFFHASEGEIQGLLTWNFIGICLSGPFYGPISDAYGRKRPLMAALGMFLIGSIITLFAQNFTFMLFGRVLQGLGSGGCFTLGTAIIFDAFQDKKAIRAINQLNLIVPILMASAPMLGGYLNQSFGFRSNFLTIALFVLASCFICWFFFEETLAKEKRAPLQTKKILQDFKNAFTCLPFWQMTLVVSLIFTGYIVFVSASAVLFVVEFGVGKEVFPYYQAAILGAWVVGSLTHSKAHAKMGVLKVKMAGLALVVIGAIGFAAASWITPQDPFFLTLGMLLFAFGANWLMGFYFAEGMEVLPDIKGVAASLLTSARLLISAVIVGTASTLYDGTIYPIVAVVVGVVVIILPIIYFYEKRRSQIPVGQAALSEHSPLH